MRSSESAGKEQRCGSETGVQALNYGLDELDERTGLDGRTKGEREIDHGRERGLEREQGERAWAVVRAQARARS